MVAAPSRQDSAWLLSAQAYGTVAPWAAPALADLPVVQRLSVLACGMNAGRKVISSARAEVEARSLSRAATSSILFELRLCAQANADPRQIAEGVIATNSYALSQGSLQFGHLNDSGWCPGKLAISISAEQVTCHSCCHARGCWLDRMDSCKIWQGRLCRVLLGGGARFGPPSAQIMK